MTDKSGRVRFIQDSGITCEVDFCDRSLNLLAHAQAIELEIGSRCGGHGECGGDRVRVASHDGAVSPITDAEREHLSAQELSSGWRLACQCWPEQSGSEMDCQVAPLQSR